MSAMISETTPDRPQRVRAYIFLASISGLVLALDQWSKYLVRTQLEVGQVWSPIEGLAAYARIIHWNNTGAAFGMLPTAGIVFTIVALAVSVAIVYYFPRVPESQTAVRIALALQLGGAVGNLIDRILLGTVTDFISLSTFPVFNVADASITLGVALLLAAMWVQDRRRKEELSAGGGSAETGEA
jgi:signal peptidase II